MVEDVYEDEDNKSQQLIVNDRLLCLFRINLTAKSGDLLCIVGQVGAGKSSILSALLGNMWCSFGSISVKGKIAYCAQQPFIQNSTLRDNILFGCPHDQERYFNALSCCALLPDIKILPGGDETEIGERGINLSGGQKARVSLARAVYADKDIYLLDDPMSAVDAHVGQHIFEHCILPLKQSGKCVILVTNALKYMKFATQIMVLKDGKVREVGTFDELMNNKSLFVDMMSTLADSNVGSVSVGKNSPLPSPVYHSNSSSKKNGKSSCSSGSSNNGDGGSNTVNAVRVDSLPTPKHHVLPNSISASSSEGKSELGNKNDKSDNNNNRSSLITVEEREVGQVDSKVYSAWIAALGGRSVALQMLFFFFLAEGVAVLSAWWLSYWSEHRS